MRSIPIPLKNPITANPGILGGTPVISGTRIPASLVLELVRTGYSQELILKEYPSITKPKLSRFFKLIANSLHAS